MCAICGCSDRTGFTLTDARGSPGTQAGAHVHVDAHGRSFEHSHGDGHDHHHDHGHGHETTRGSADAEQHARRHGSVIAVERALMAKNDAAAARNRGWLKQRRITALNLVSAPGAGKTSLLERSLIDLRGELDMVVIEGDQETLNDAERIRATGSRAVQINTGAGCHLDGDMVAAGLAALAPAEGSVVVIENVGNLVCPALFDLGENARVAVLSVTEGEDKPLKYPQMFRSSELLLLNKIDLLPHLRFDLQACLAHARRVNPRIHIIQVSAITGEGMSDWYAWLKQRRVAILGEALLATP